MQGWGGNGCHKHWSSVCTSGPGLLLECHLCLVGRASRVLLKLAGDSVAAARRWLELHGDLVSEKLREGLQPHVAVEEAVLKVCVCP